MEREARHRRRRNMDARVVRGKNFPEPHVSPTMPVATLLLILANCLAYLFEIETGGQEVCATFGMVPAHFSYGSVFSSLFLHDYRGFSHLIGNMGCLLIVGIIVERELGATRFLVVYFAAGLLGGLTHLLVNPAAAQPLVGASGAICGVLAVACALRPRLVGFAIGFCLMNILTAIFGGDDGASFGAHLGGMATGVIFAAVMRVTESREMEEA